MRGRAQRFTVIPVFVLLIAFCTCISAFCEDNYEPNNNLVSAYDLSHDERTWLSSIDGPGEQHDEDWYKIYVNPGAERVLIECDFVHPDGNITLVLFDSTGALEKVSATYSNNEHIDSVVSAPGTHYIRVSSGANVGNSYDLWWDDVAPGSGDPYEYVWTGAGYVPNNSRQNAWYPDRDWEREWLSDIRGIARAGDDDWYEIDVSSSIYNRLTAICQFDHALGNINMQLVDGSGDVLWTAASATDNEHIVYSVPDGGKYYLHVYGGNPGQSYDLWWDDTPQIADDAYEITYLNHQNDTRSDAWFPGDPGVIHSWERIPLSRFFGMPIQNDEDWYKINVNNDRILISCIFPHALGDINLQLYDEGGSLLAGSLTFDDNEYIDYNSPSTYATYYIRITGEDNGANYDLWWDDKATDSDDAYENNDTTGTAYHPSNNWERRWLTVLEGVGIQRDEDWYRIDLSAGAGRVLAECKFRHSGGDINLALYDASGNLLSNSASASNNEYIDYTDNTYSTHYLRVYGDNTGNMYDLWWDDTVDDSYEQNDTRAAAYDIHNKERRWFTDLSGYGVQNDDDWYRISVNSNVLRVVVDCRFSHADGNIDIALVDDSGTTLAVANSTDDNECIAHLVPSAGTYYIRVYGDNAGADYNLWWDDTLNKQTYQFAIGTEGWTWFDYAPAFVAPEHEYDAVGDRLRMSLSVPTDQIAFGSWESPKDPTMTVSPLENRVFRARYTLASSVEGATCPGFRLRAVTTHVIQPSHHVWIPDFSNQDFNASHEVYYSTVDAFHIDGREPGAAGKVYTLLMTPVPATSLLSSDVVNYFTCDLLDLDTFDSDAGEIYVERVSIDSFADPLSGTRVPELSFNDQPGSNDFSSWSPLLMPLDPARINITGIDVSATADRLQVTVAPGNQWFVATHASPGTPLTPGRYYRATFNISSTGGSPGDFGPTVRAGFYSTRLIYGVDKELAGGGSYAHFTSTPRAFEVWMVAPSQLGGGVTEPIGLRFMSWLGDNPTGWPFFANVSGTVRCHSIRTESFDPFP